MKIIKSQDVNIITNSLQCTVDEYPLGQSQANFSLATINGRYPELDFAINKICSEYVYVLEGSGEIILENNTSAIKTGDLIFIDKNEKFAWSGNMKISMFCVPAWSPEQHLIVQ